MHIYFILFQRGNDLLWHDRSMHHSSVVLHTSVICT